MMVKFFDMQFPANSANGIIFENDEEFSKLLASLWARKPFFCELLADNGYKQLIGIGGLLGCVQHSTSDGNPPYLMAVADEGLSAKSEIEFLIGNTPTPIPIRYCTSFEKTKQIAIYFFKTGKRDPSISWEEI